jgi:predicted Zn-dependent protease
MAASVTMSNVVKKIFSSMLVVMMVVTGFSRPAAGFSVGEERELGEKLLYAVRASFPIIDDPDLQQYISDIGREVLEVAGIQYFDYHFHIVESEQFNAFAAPSGLIFFYTKLIESMNSEDELISVMAHEVGHVVRRHLASRMKKGAVINIASLGVALAAIALGGGAAAQGLIAGSMAAGQSAQLHFSREDEIEADLLAYQWMQELHRDTYGQKKMLQTMRRITRYRSDQIPQYLLTHPNPEARLDYVESLIAADSDYSVDYDESVNFAFLRFKYRLMSITDRSSTTRAYLASKMSDSRASEFDKTMALYGLSQVDLRSNNFDQSLSRLDKVIEALPDKTILLIDKAVVLAAKGDLPQARLLLEQSLRRDGASSYTRYQLASVLVKMGEPEEALNLFQEVSFDMPEFSDVYFDMGRVLSGLGRNVESRYNLGKYNLYEGKIKLAEANFKQVVKTAVKDSDLARDSQEMLALIERLKKK